MRASEGDAHERGGRHLSGAERLVPAEVLEETAAELFRRALAAGAEPDFIRLTVERVPASSLRCVPCLPVISARARDPAESRAVSRELLLAAGIAAAAIDRAMAGLRDGWVDGAPLRGAALLDAATGERLDARPERGVRASRMDYAPGARVELDQVLGAAGLGHFRTREALAVATKVMACGVLAEICWSDEPSYVAGYVATPRDGYVRFPEFKPVGAVGGRAFFLSSGADVAAVTRRLERESLWITGPFHIKRADAGES